MIYVDSFQFSGDLDVEILMMPEIEAEHFYNTNEPKIKVSWFLHPYGMIIYL
jgi:hypothetical protein